MQVLRDSKESLMAVLEAFVYDPLINWRLMQTEADAPRAEESGIDPERAAELARTAGHPQGPSRKLKADENEIFNGMCKTPCLENDILS
jgi:FKBP12-rapamycin complex-associated protein